MYFSNDLETRHHRAGSAQHFLSSGERLPEPEGLEPAISPGTE